MDEEAPFHAGELRVQERMGVSAGAARLAGMFASAVGPRVAGFLESQHVAVAASVSPEGEVWASLLVGRPGFIRPLGEDRVAFEGYPREEDVLATNLAAEAPLGLLVIDLANRRRVRLNGRVVAGRPLQVRVERVYGNCPKYIHPRVPRLEDGACAVRRRSSLDLEDQRLLRAADTLFIASRHPRAGADASHRGGPPGFVEVHDERTLSFADLPGNDMFNTLGNLEEEPRAGLLVPDFATGATLQLSGRAEVSFEARPRVTFHVRAVVHTTGRGLRA